MSTVLVIDDNETIRLGLELTIKKMGHAVLTASNGVEGLEILDANPTIDFVMTDLKMDGLSGVEVLRELGQRRPDVPTMIMTGYGTVETAVEAMKLGAFDFLTKPFSPEVVRFKVSAALELAAVKKAKRMLEAQNEYLRGEAEERYSFAELIGGSEAMRYVFETIERVARTDSAVFIGGESGTGKELVARAIHRHSKRADRPFIKVNCGALTENLLESELFGHERGAFTGAVRTKLGRFELADGGTLFLDEVGDISLSMQVKLLRALQEQEFERVGGETTVRVDVRVVSATNKNLTELVESGAIREDFYYRLHVVPLSLPALRERREDIGLLVGHFIEKLAPRTNPKVRTIADDALGRLLAYSWPGNVRELENAIEQCLVFADGDRIEVATLPGFLRGAPNEDTLAVDKAMSLPEILDDLERQLIVKAYKTADGVKTETARSLGIKTSALYYKLDKYNIR